MTDVIPNYSPRAMAIRALTNIKQKLSGTMRRRLLRNTGENIGAKTRPEPTDDAVRMARRLSRATWAQLDKWIRRVNRRLPQIEKTLEDAKAAGLIRQVSMLQVKVDQLKFVLRGFTTEVTFRKAKIAAIADKKNSIEAKVLNIPFSLTDEETKTIAAAINKKNI